jgi:hypothetical protein
MATVSPVLTDWPGVDGDGDDQTRHGRLDQFRGVGGDLLRQAGEEFGVVGRQDADAGFRRAAADLEAAGDAFDLGGEGLAVEHAAELGQTRAPVDVGQLQARSSSISSSVRASSSS